MIRTGLDVFLQNRRNFDLNGPVGLLSNVASLTSDGLTTYRALCNSGVDVQALFAPEGGYFGVGAEDEVIASDRRRSVPIYRLYGENYEPPADVLGSLSTLVIDLQEVGTRWYTFLTTIQDMLLACAAIGTPVLLLDRPNPQGGIIVEGSLAEAAYFSKFAPAAMPVRYGLTIGEAATWLNDRLKSGLTVVKMEGWQRDMLYADTGLLWSAPSPTLINSDTTLLYSGTGLIETLNVSDGRGTAAPYAQIGAPFIDAEDLSEDMNTLALPGLHFTPVWFSPVSGQFTGLRCQGTRIHITEARQVHGFAMGLYLIATLRRLYRDEIEWQYWDNRSVFEGLTATAAIRESLEIKQPVEEIVRWCADAAEAFQARSAPFWLYD